MTTTNPTAELLDPYAERVTVTVPVQIRELMVLREVAAAHRQTPEQYLAWLVRNIVAGQVTHNEVAREWARGKSDAEIARALDMTNAQVRDRRYRLGLPANRKARA